MGSMDRDYMKDTGRDRPFSPPPESSMTGWLVKLVVFACVIYFGFKLVQWIDNRSIPAQSKSVATATTPKETQLQQPTAQLPPQPIPSDSQTPDAAGQPAMITKCVINGKTSYGDDSCASGAVTSKVATKVNQNLLVAVKAAPPTQVRAPEPAPVVIAQTSPNQDQATLKAECSFLEGRIKYLDDLARQPQSGQTQDWIRDQRKTARDRQFAIRCQ